MMIEPAMTKPSAHAPLRLPLAFLAMALLATGCATFEARYTDTAAPAVAPRPAIVEGPTRIEGFRPQDTSVAVDITTLDLRQVFEDVGEDGTLWYQHVQTLANPYFEGRVNGSQGTERAREYMEWFFRLYELEPAFPAEDTELGGESGSAAWVSYAQPFEFGARPRTTVIVENEFASIADDQLDSGDDFVVLGNSGSGEVTAPVTFVGYAIEEGSEGYTSFEDDTDLTGRIALVLRYEPLDEAGSSRWADEGFSRRAGMNSKMRAVADRGAAGIILVNPPGAVDGRTGLEPLSSSARFGRGLDVPVIQVTPEAAETLVVHGGGESLLALRQAADEGAMPQAFPESVQVSFGADVARERLREQIPARNIGAVLPGRGDLADQWLVIGGHYDHNGYGFFGTDPSNGPLFPGADDNASGTAGVLVLAKKLSEHYAELSDGAARRSVLFIAFDAEERGLHGSRYFTRNPTMPPEKMTALLNMDMIGRLRSNKLSVLGVRTADGFEDMLRPHFEESGLTIAVTASGSGRSDDANFARVGVPGLHFFTGMHPEYTSPADQAYTVNPIGAAKIIDLMYAIAVDLVSSPHQFAFSEPPANEPRQGQDRAYAPVRLGIQPGMGEELDTGILVEAVSAGTSAADGGLRSGDIMLSWDGTELETMRTLVEMLRNHKPGDVAKIKIKRDGKEIELPVTLKASR